MKKGVVEFVRRAAIQKTEKPSKSGTGLKKEGAGF